MALLGGLLFISGFQMGAALRHQRGWRLRVATASLTALWAWKVGLPRLLDYGIQRAQPGPAGRGALDVLGLAGLLVFGLLLGVTVAHAALRSAAARRLLSGSWLPSLALPLLALPFVFGPAAALVLPGRVVFALLLVLVLVEASRLLTRIASPALSRWLQPALVLGGYWAFVPSYAYVPLAAAWTIGYTAAGVPIVDLLDDLRHVSPAAPGAAVALALVATLAFFVGSPPPGIAWVCTPCFVFFGGALRWQGDLNASQPVPA